MIEAFIEVRLKQKEDFLKVRETLTRIGIASKKSNTLYQSAHILHKRGKFYIVHFKQMFGLDGKRSTLSDDDLARTRRIAKLLSSWGLIELVNPIEEDECAPASQVKIIRHEDKGKWQLVPKYTIGRKSSEKRPSGEAPAS